MPEAPERVRGCCVPLAPLLNGEAAEELAMVYKALADPTRVQMRSSPDRPVNRRGFGHHAAVRSLRLLRRFG
jgi:hypothetical protein